MTDQLLERQAAVERLKMDKHELRVWIEYLERNEPKKPDHSANDIVHNLVQMTVDCLRYLRIQKIEYPFLAV
ncbi:hypothetical protein ACOME3_010597 [Neoechinorhynchus agilis]